MSVDLGSKISVICPNLTLSVRHIHCKLSQAYRRTFKVMKSNWLVLNLHLTAQKNADLVTFTEEILNEKLHFLCNVKIVKPIYAALSTITLCHFTYTRDKDSMTTGISWLKPSFVIGINFIIETPSLGNCQLMLKRDWHDDMIETMPCYASKWFQRLHCFLTMN